MSPTSTPYYTFEGEQLINHVWEPIILETGSSISWSDLHPYSGEVNEETLKTFYLVPDLLSGGDYSSSSEVQVSNHRVFLKEFKNVDGVYNVYGGFGSFAVAIRADIAESNERIKETLDGLENYPVIDDDDMSELRNEWEQLAVQDMIHGIQNSIENDLEELIKDTDTDSEKIELIIWDGINELGLEWSYEDSSAYLDADKVLPYVEDRILLEQCKDLPLLVDRKWSCDKTQTMYEQKLKGVPDGQDSASPGCGKDYQALPEKSNNS